MKKFNAQITPSAEEMINEAAEKTNMVFKRLPRKSNKNKLISYLAVPLLMIWLVAVMSVSAYLGSPERNIKIQKWIYNEAMIERDSAQDTVNRMNKIMKLASESADLSREELGK